MNLWKKNNLPKSDSQHPTNGSNATCNLRLSQAGYEVNGQKIDQKTYFRENVFADCNWEETEKGEKTHILADLEIDGESKGRYNLKVTHESHREANQDNVTTILHWEEAISVLRENDVTGKNLSLDRDEDGIYQIKID